MYSWQLFRPRAVFCDLLPHHRLRSPVLGTAYDVKHSEPCFLAGDCSGLRARGPRLIVPCCVRRRPVSRSKRRRWVPGLGGSVSPSSDRIDAARAGAGVR